MKELKIVLDNNDVNIIFETLCDSLETDISDSVLTDLFMMLSKSSNNVVITVDTMDDSSMDKITENGIRKLADSVGEILGDLGDLGDLGSPTEPENGNDTPQEVGFDDSSDGWDEYPPDWCFDCNNHGDECICDEDDEDDEDDDDDGPWETHPDCWDTK